MDGAVGEIVTNHPLFTETFGFCALSLLSEAMQNGDVDAVAVPRYERCNETFARHDFDDGMDGQGGQSNPFKNMNSLSLTKKLEWSLQMAEAIAVLSNYENGVIVHDDIQLPQFLLGQDGRVKLVCIHVCCVVLLAFFSHGRLTLSITTTASVTVPHRSRMTSTGQRSCSLTRRITNTAGNNDLLLCVRFMRACIHW